MEIRIKIKTSQNVVFRKINLQVMLSEKVKFGYVYSRKYFLTFIFENSTGFVLPKMNNKIIFVFVIVFVES